jgi:hypothetical protein
MFEWLYRAVATASTFGEDDEDGSFFLQFPAQIGKRVRAAILPPHRQSVEHDCRKRAGHIALKENIAGGDGKGAFAMARSKCSSKSQRIEVAAMIRGKDKRPVRRQILAAHDCKSMSYREVNSEQRKTNMMRDTFEQAALSPHTTEAFSRAQPGVMRWLKLPGFHCR